MHKMPLLLALILFVTMTLPMPRVWAADGQKLLLEKSFPTESGERLKVNSYAGTVKINCWQKNELTIRIYGTSEAEMYLDFDIISDELGINILASKKAEIDDVKDLDLRYEICVPRDYDVRVSGEGNVTVDNRHNPISVGN